MKTNKARFFDTGILFMIWAVALVLMVYPMSAFVASHFVAHTVRLIMGGASLVLLATGIGMVFWEYKR